MTHIKHVLSDRDTPTERLARIANTERHTPVGTAVAKEQLAGVVDKIDAAIDDLVRS